MINIHPKVSGTNTLHTSEHYVTNFSHCVEPSCLEVEKRNPVNAVKFFKESAVKYLRNILEKFSDLISEKKILQTSENYAINFEKFDQSLCPQVTNLFDLLNNTRFLKVMVTIHGRKNWL